MKMAIHETLKPAPLPSDRYICLIPIIIYKTLKRMFYRTDREKSLTPIIIYKTLKRYVAVQLQRPA